MEITLALLIQDWVKLRGLKWYVKGSRLEMILPDILEATITIEDTYVTYTGPTLWRRFFNVFTGEIDKKVDLAAADPRFFEKLERIIRREERYLHFACNLRLLGIAVDKVLGPLNSVVFEWSVERLDEINDWWESRSYK
jgi:hypothetical protein